MHRQTSKSKFEFSCPNQILKTGKFVGAVPKRWKNLITEYGRLDDIKNDIVNRLKSDKKKPAKYFYKLYLENIKESPLRSQIKWTQELGIQINDWWYIYSSPFRATRNTKLQNFQFKLSHRITATNSFLFKCGLKETELCTFCTGTKESLLHLFWECTYTNNFWFSLVNILESCGLNMQYINAPNIILGITNPLDPDNTNNQVILILKYYLYKCRCLGDKPSINGGIKYLKYCIKIEKTTINFLSSTQKEYICKKWLPFENLLGV